MLALKYLLMILGVGLFGSSGILVAYDIYIAARLRWLLEQTSGEPGTEAVQRETARPFGPVRWRLALQLAAADHLAGLFLLENKGGPARAPGARVSPPSRACHRAARPVSPHNP